MQIERDYRNLELGAGRAISVGVFDGVHLGHRRIFGRLVEVARQRGLEPVGVSFDLHPLAVVAPDRVPPLLSTLDERARLLGELGVERLVVLPFDRELAGLTAEEFTRRVLVEALGARAVLEGSNFTFGRGATGNCRLLRRLGRELGFYCEVLPPVRAGGDIVSSSLIRRCLAEGRVDLAARYLERPYALPGLVVPGDRRGRTLGFPTANLEVAAERAVPGAGVYAVRVAVDKRSYGGMANLGRRPTFAGERESLEVHLFDYAGDLYGREIVVSFVQRLRNEQRLSGPAELTAQLRRDMELAREILARKFTPKSSYATMGSV